MDRIVRPPGFDERRDLSRFVGAGSPIACERDADLAGVAAQPVNSVVSVLAIIGLEWMAPTDSKSPIFGQPLPKSVRREGGEGWIGQALSGFRARARPMRLGMLLLIGDEGRARQLAQILKVFAHAVRAVARQSGAAARFRPRACDRNPRSADHRSDVLGAKPLGVRARERLRRALDHAGRRAQRLSERRRIASVLQHEIEREIRRLEILRQHARQLELDDRARRGAAQDELGDLLVLEAGLFGDRERLGERGDLTCGELVVDELPGRARADRPEQIHLAAHRRKRGARRLVGLGVAADKEPQFAALRRRTAAADRRIEKADALGLSLTAKLADPVGGQRAGFNADRAALRSGERAVRARARRSARRRRPPPWRR